MFSAVINVCARVSQTVVTFVFMITFAMAQ